MHLTTADDLDGRKFVTLGIAKGTVVYAENLWRRFLSGLKAATGGEIKQYTKMLEDARETATRRMILHADSLGADGIICMRYSSYYIMHGAVEIMAYGTAVKFK